MGRKVKPLQECRTTRDFRRYGEGRGGQWVARGNHSGIAADGVFVPVPVRRGEIAKGTASAVRRSFRALGWKLAPFVLGPLAGAIAWLLAHGL